MAEAISATRALTSSTALADRLERHARALDGGDALVRAAGAVGDDADHDAGLGLDLLDQPGDLGRGALRLLGELAHLVGDDGEAASVLAGACRLDRGVQRQQVGLIGDRGDRVDDAADPLGALRQRADRRADALGRVGDLLDRGGRLARPRPTPSSATDARLVGGLGGRPARCARCSRRPARPRRRRRASRRPCGPGARRRRRRRTWRRRSRPPRGPASSEVEAICCEADDTVPALSDSSRRTSPSCARIAL